MQDRPEASGSITGETVPNPSPLDLIVSLVDQLEELQIAFCHWKSNEAIHLSEIGVNDLDLLVDRRDIDPFNAVINSLGFKPARPSRSREVPGLLDFYGLDDPTGLLVHLQAHFQLVLGDDMTKNFRLPVEGQYLASRSHDDLFPLPAPVFELAVFVVRMVLKHASWDAQVCLLGSLSTSEAREYAYLKDRVPVSERASGVLELLPFLTPALADACLGAFEPETTARQRVATARTLERRLAAQSRRAPFHDVALRIGRRSLRLAAHAAHRPAKKRLVAGGLLIAVTSLDGALARSVADDLATWLGSAFEVATGPMDGSGPARSSQAYAVARRRAINGAISIWAQAAAPSKHESLGPGRDDQPPDILIEVGEMGDMAASGSISSLTVQMNERPTEDERRTVRRLIWESL